MYAERMTEIWCDREHRGSEGSSRFRTGPVSYISVLIKPGIEAPAWTDKESRLADEKRPLLEISSGRKLLSHPALENKPQAELQYSGRISSGPLRDAAKVAWVAHIGIGRTENDGV